MKTDDAELVRRIAAGDETALRGLFARHQTRVYRFVLRLVGNAAVAEEVTNEVFLEVWRNAGKFEGASAAGTWILSIAHHRAVSQLRKRREESWNEDAAGALEDAGDDPEVAAQKSDKGAILRLCLEKLSPEQRWAVVAYVRALQVSQRARLEDVPPEARPLLLKGGTP